MKKGMMHTMIRASVLSMKKRKRKAPVNCNVVVMNDGTVSVAKFTTSVTSRSRRLVRFPV